MRRARVFLGIALIIAATALGALGVRSIVGDRARAQAALLRGASEPESDRGATEKTAAEKKVWEAARLEPLEAALRAHVDTTTMRDLFDNEDWWRPYRAAFPIVHLEVGELTLASRGPELGSAAHEMIGAARKRQIASTIVEVNGQSYVVAAASLAGGADFDAVLLFGRPVSLPAPAPAPARVDAVVTGAELADHQGLLLLTLGIAVGGAALVISGRRGRAVVGAIPTEVPHEPTSKFGTPARPRAGAHAELTTSPERRQGRITDGEAVSIRGGSAPAHSLAMARPRSVGAGAVFGRYRLVDRLGEGGMSELFIAEVTGVEGFTRNFVLKRLRPELAREKEAVAQFIDEARMQAGLVHSNIVPVFDFGVVGGEYFMTQEYIVGRDLGRVVGRWIEQHPTGGLPESVAYYLAHETLQGLSYAHERRDKDGGPMGIGHRVISASNVMLSLLGEVKLSDFGIVKSNRRVSKTQVGMVKGNANFMSPEQARGQTVDHRSDIFSLAHVLYYALAGELLYYGENDLDVLYRASSGVSESDLARIRALPDPAAGILEKALAFEPAERFQSAAEFADALAAHASGGKSATARLVTQLFGEELQRQVQATVSAG